jgi:hypothetical protein
MGHVVWALILGDCRCPCGATGSASGLIPSGAPPLELNVEQDELPSNRKLKTAFSIKGRPYVYQSDVARTGNDFV